mmetsp:Transcript_42417/g.40663  ORF Transcript_42417/g.40663 Transcript_42417/m.40663 type:complete len:181 (-) Transcript_42417:1029-1571(-)
MDLDSVLKSSQRTENKPPRCIKINPRPHTKGSEEQSTKQIKHFDIVETPHTPKVMCQSSKRLLNMQKLCPEERPRNYSYHIEKGPEMLQEGGDLARYYERSISQMNINRIREMQSKEVVKVSDQDIKRNASPINAMMIVQPPKGAAKDLTPTNKSRKDVSGSAKSQVRQNSSKRGTTPKS